MSMFPSRVTPAQRLMQSQVMRRAKNSLTDVRVDVDQLLRRIGEEAGKVRPHNHPLIVSGPFLFDYLCDPLWDGLQGRVFQTNHGHEYRVFTQVNAAVADANTRFATAEANFGLAPGNYDNMVIGSGLTTPAHRYFFGFGASGGGLQNAAVNIGETVGVGLTISESDPEYTFSNMQFDGASSGNSVLGNATNIAAFFEGVTFTRAVSADFAGAGFGRCHFLQEGYMANSGHSPATVFFDTCRFTLVVPMVWTGGVSDHYFSNCELGAAADRIQIVGGTNQDIKFENCDLDTSGSPKRFFDLDGAAATLSQLGFLGCGFGAPADANGNIYFQDHGGCISVQIVGNSFTKVNAVQNPYITSDVEVRAAIILGNTFGFDGFGPSGIYNEQELASSSSVEGLFTNSIFGPNAPGMVVQYDITGDENEFYPGSSAIGASVPSPLAYLSSITRQQAHALAVR